jgi:D-amino-acid dehydrogenase
MAAGTGRVMADLLSGREPEISMEGLTVARYGRGARSVHLPAAQPALARKS